MILLAGAASTLGQHIALELKMRRTSFRALTHGPSQAETPPESFAGVTAALLLSPLHPELVSWEAAFARLARKAGVKKIVKISALGADRLSSCSALRWHGEAEQELRRVGPTCTMLRPGAFYQNLLNSAESMRRGTLSAPMGAGAIAMIDARDVATAAAAALTQDVFDAAEVGLTGPQALSYAQVAQIYSEVFKRPLQFLDAAPEAARRGMLKAGMTPWRVEALLGLAEYFRAGRCEIVSNSFYKMTGRAPLGLDAFFRDHASAFS